MFKIIEGDFKNNKYSDEEYLDNWPMLYILENGRQAYIGESSHVKTRMTQHSSIEEKRIFDKVHFIYSKLFNQSVTFDYESKLIQYIAADELYEVTNKIKVLRISNIIKAGIRREICNPLEKASKRKAGKAFHRGN